MKAPVPPPKSPVPRIFLDEAETLTGALAALVERFPDYDCLALLDRRQSERRMSLQALWTRASEIQALLIERGLRPHGFVLVILPTGPELVAAYFGAMLAGGIPALVATPSGRLSDRRAYAQRVSSILRNASGCTVYGDREIADIFRENSDALPDDTTILTPGDAVAAEATPSVVTPDPDDIATVQYSSGSTGTPKGILLTHRAMLNNIRAVRNGLGLSSDDVSVNWIPLYHDMGLIDAYLLPLLSGCRTVLMPTMDFMRDPASWLWAMHRYRGTISWAPNFAYALCAKRLAEKQLQGLDLSCWRIAINAAEPVLAPTIEAFTNRFRRYGFRPEAMTPAWGLAENVTIATAHRSKRRPRVETIDRQRLAAEHVAYPVEGSTAGLVSVAIGECLPHCEVEIRGPDGGRLPDRHVGTVSMRSDSLFIGYHHDEVLTDRMLVDGWLNTGDQGYMVDGQLFFVSREKDIIVVGGDKYAPHDVETAINGVRGVREGCAIAFGVLNEERGTEDVAAVVETKETDEREIEALRDTIRREVTRVTGLVLRYVILVPPGGVEKTTSGKLARDATRRSYADQLV